MARILVADDDSVTLDLIKRALEGDGHEVITVGDGSEACQRLEDGEVFDLIVTDVDMPELDGIALAERAIALRPDQRIIIMSVIADELTRGRQLEGGRVRIVTKPVTLEKIRGEAAELLA